MNRYPLLTIEVDQLKENVALMKKAIDPCTLMGVTKVFCAVPELVQAYVDGGVDYLADSRIENMIKLKDYNVPKVLLRLPMASQAEDVVTYCDLSLNSELTTIMALNAAAQQKGITHKIMLMVDLGDLREGIWPVDAEATVEAILQMKNIELYGLGVNLTCYGGVVPKEDNVGQLVTLARALEQTFNMTFQMLSGGNSSSYYLAETQKLPAGINNLRLGEALVLGRETAYGDMIEGAHDGIFTLTAEIVELKEKPSLPIGEIGMDAFGNKPEFEDRGLRKRAILAIGRQDVNPGNLIPYDKNIFVLGASSDHLIMDVTDSHAEYHVGDAIHFNVEYGALLPLMTSEYVTKVYI
jgi:predicted amino acid racemase